MFKTIDSKKSKGLCVAHRCSNKSTPKDRFCSKHSKRYQKHKNAIKYTYHQKKFRAIERGISWELTVKEFTDFCSYTNYMELKGKTSTSASIDRIRSEEGYHKDNIQILTLGDNTRKMHEDNCPF